MLKKTAIIIAVVFIAAAVMGCGSVKSGSVFDEKSGDSSDKVQKIVDKFISVEAPDFTLEKADGTKVTLSDLKGKPVVLNFWATWCPYCIAEFGHFTKAQQNFTQIQFLGIDTSEKEDMSDDAVQQKIEQFAKDKGFDLPIVFDVDSKLAAGDYASQGLPTTFLIDSEGNVRYYLPGAVPDYETLENMLNALLKVSE
jgi:peroxiredoxin